MLLDLRRVLAASMAGLCVAGAAVSGGCHREGPWPGASLDQYTYVSRSWEPKTITLVDTRTNEPVWSVDIPVGQQLVVGFSEGTGPNEYKPDEVVWELMAAGKRFGTRNNRQACPPSYARRIDMSIRPTPESVWSDVPGSPYYRPEPRPVRRVGGRVVEPVEDESAMPAPGEGDVPGRRELAPDQVPPDLRPEEMEPEPTAFPEEAPGEETPEELSEPQPAEEQAPIEIPEPEPAPARPAPTGQPDYEEVPPSGDPEPAQEEPEEPPIDIPEAR